MNVSLDAGPMVAYIHHEPGEDVVAELFQSPETVCYAHAINILEVHYHFLRGYNQQTADKAIEDLIADGVIIREDMDMDFLRMISSLKSRGRISLADCFCIALAQRLSGEVVTTNHHEFDALVPLNIVSINFIR